MEALTLMASAPLLRLEGMEKQYYRILLVIFWSIVTGCAVLYGVFSLAGLKGVMAGLAPKTVMVWTYTMVMLTIVAIPLVLKYVREQKNRIVLLGAVLELNTLSHVMLDNRSLGYLTLLTLVAMIFVYPQKTLNEEDQKTVEGLEKGNGKQ